MGDGAIKNPDLLHRITLREFRNDPKNKGMRVEDRNHNGVVDHDDRLVSSSQREMDAGPILNDMCRDHIPNDTAITTTPEAKRTLRSEGAAVRSDRNSSDVRFDTLKTRTGKVASWGAYDPTVSGCNYNRTGFHLEKGQGPHEVKASFEDAKGTQQRLFNIQTGVIRNTK